MRTRLIASVLFFLTITNFSLQASNSSLSNDDLPTISQYNDVFEITTAFISGWTIREIRDHVVIEVIETNDFKVAHEVIDELRKFVNEPILVKHGFADNKIVYTVTIGRFDNINDAQQYHSMLL